jgi:ATP-dependent helicase/nuclease subunit A
VAKLLADAHASGLVTVHEFLDYVAGQRAGAVREGEARATAGDAVRIMSVHAAKGLEFPIVVLGDINHKSPSGSDLFLDPELGVLPRMVDEEGRLPGRYRLLKQRADDQEDAEAERLLYVAATRVEEKLILNGNIRLSQAGRLGWLAGWMKDLATPLGLKELEVAYDGDGDRAHKYDLVVGSTPVACTLFEPGYPAVQAPAPVLDQGEPAGEWSPTLLGPIEPDRHEADEETRQKEQDPPLRVWRVIPAVQRPRAPAWIVGALVHEVLAVWRFPDNGFDQWVKARAREHGLADEQRLGDAVRQTRKLLSRFKNHSLYAEMDTAERRLHELPYSRTLDGGAVEQGIIDALYLKDGTWTVVEFKTDRLRDAAALTRLPEKEKYRAQIRDYGVAVERLTGNEPRLILLFLNYGGNVGGIHEEIVEKGN